MIKKVLLAGILGGLALFAWGAVAHVALPLGDAGLAEMPNREAVLGALGETPAEAVIYYFPPEGSDVTKPVGLLVHDPDGVSTGMAKELATQALTDVLVAFVAALLLSWAIGSLPRYACRVGFVTVLSALPTLCVLVPYWNWYGFACSFTLGGIVEQVVGFLVVGLVAGAIVKPPATSAA